MSRFDERTIHTSMGLTPTKNEKYFKENLTAKKNSDISIYDNQIKFKYFDRAIVDQWREKEYHGGAGYTTTHTEYEFITKFMERIASWINENNIKPVAMFLVNNEHGFIIFYY